VLHDLVHLGISPGEKVVRTVAVYLFLFALLRLAGKRQLAQLNTFDFVVFLLLSNVVQNAIIGNDNSLVGGLLGAVVLVAGNYVVVRFVLMNRLLGPHLEGRETVLVAGGRLDETALKRELISPIELDEALRRQGYDGIAGVERVVLDPGGMFDVTPRRRVTLEEVAATLDRIERKLNGVG
jgi:uncharacterized membrane protein YcaP (DUF421 family)